MCVALLFLALAALALWAMSRLPDSPPPKNEIARMAWIMREKTMLHKEALEAYIALLRAAAEGNATNRRPPSDETE